MKSYIFTIYFLPAILALVLMPIGSRAFMNSNQSTKLQPNPQSSRFEVLKAPIFSTQTNHGLQGSQRDDDIIESPDKNIAFVKLSTDRDNKPNQGNFFYNDEVISHLYGYMYLVGFFAAQDSLFVGNFLVLSSLTAWATQEALLPCNPRIPAITAAMTLASTIFLRYIVGFELPLETILESYQGPTQSSTLFEVIICALNIGWGFFGTWRTKEQVNGATYGF